MIITLRSAVLEIKKEKLEGGFEFSSLGIGISWSGVIPLQRRLMLTPFIVTLK